MITNAPKPISADPPANPSRPSVTLTALVVAQMIRPAKATHTTVGGCHPGRSARVNEMVSAMPVPRTSHQAMPKLSSIVM